MQFRVDNLVCRLDTRAALHVQSEDSVSAGRCSVQIVLADCLVHQTFKQAVQGFLLSVTDLLCEAFDGDTTALIISDLQVLVTCDGPSRFIWEQITNLLVIDLSVTDSDRDRLVKLVRCEGVQL